MQSCMPLVSPLRAEAKGLFKPWSLQTDNIRRACFKGIVKKTNWWSVMKWILNCGGECSWGAKPSLPCSPQLWEWMLSASPAWVWSELEGSVFRVLWFWSQWGAGDKCCLFRFCWIVRCPTPVLGYCWIWDGPFLGFFRVLTYFYKDVRKCF